MDRKTFDFQTLDYFNITDEIKAKTGRNKLMYFIKDISKLRQ